MDSDCCFFKKSQQKIMFFENVTSNPPNISVGLQDIPPKLLTAETIFLVFAWLGFLLVISAITIELMRAKRNESPPDRELQSVDIV